MKYLTDYIQEEQTALLEELGVFFAFSGDQLREGINKYKDKLPAGTKWSAVGTAGMYMPKVNIDEFIKRHDALSEVGRVKDLEENGREAVLERELGNYEIGYSWEGYNDIGFRNAIDGYGFTEEEIKSAFNKHMREHEY